MGRWRTILMQVLGRLGRWLIKIGGQNQQLPLALPPAPILLPAEPPEVPHRIAEPHSDYLLVLRDGRHMMIHYGLQTPIEWTVAAKKDLSRTHGRVEQDSYWMEWRLLPKEESWPNEWRTH